MLGKCQAKGTLLPMCTGMSMPHSLQVMVRSALCNSSCLFMTPEAVMILPPAVMPCVYSIVPTLAFISTTHSIHLQPTQAHLDERRVALRCLQELPHCVGSIRHRVFAPVIACRLQRVGPECWHLFHEFICGTSMQNPCEACVPLAARHAQGQLVGCVCNAHPAIPHSRLLRVEAEECVSSAQEHCLSCHAC